MHIIYQWKIVCERVLQQIFLKWAIPHAHMHEQDMYHNILPLSTTGSYQLSTAHTFSYYDYRPATRS